MRYDLATSFGEPRRRDHGRRLPGGDSEQLAGLPRMLMLIAAFWAVIVIAATVLLVASGQSSP